MSFKAQATTGVLGQRLIAGFDLANVFVDNMGDQIQVWDREVSYVDTVTLAEVLSSDKYIRFDLLANILVKDEKVSRKTEVSLYASGNVKEIRVDKLAYRCKGTKYYGTNKKPTIDIVDEEI
jgi:hypothetical protein